MKFQGWAITYWLSFSILLVVVLFLFIAGWYPSSILVAIRSTGRTSLILFSAAVTASSVYHFWEIPFSKWVLRNRRYIGVSFAASHFIHLALIGAIALAFPEPFLKDQAPSQWIFGGLGYVFVALMALTSSDRAQQWMGMKKWKKLHLVGGYYIWFVFFITYIKHTKQDPTFYTPFLVFTGAVLVLRIVKHLHVGRIKKS
jgi:sulfoxide reductase heme-binding subunit YedZ|tara:strand:+ start:262 stop:861 length:600 start_codon:yes stop_codon:yes gene_type:complete